MKTKTQSDHEIALQIVQGERPLADLPLTGMEIRLEGDKCKVTNPRKVALAVTGPDLAKGLLAHNHDVKSLREWALFLQAADLDLDVEQHPERETLLNALWDASFLNPISSETVKVLEEVARTNKWAP